MSAGSVPGPVEMLDTVPLSTENMLQVTAEVVYSWMRGYPPRGMGPEEVVTSGIHQKEPQQQHK